MLSANVLPRTRIDSGEFTWSGIRHQFFEGFHNSIPALAMAGNYLIVEHIVETRAWLSRLLRLLAGSDDFFVGVRGLARAHCAARVRLDGRGNVEFGECGLTLRSSELPPAGGLAARLKRQASIERKA